MRKTCGHCGARCQGAFCYRHKPKKAIPRGKPIRKRAKVRGRHESSYEKETVGPTAKPTLRKLKPIMTRKFSIYVRLRDSDEKGVCTCITCNNREYWKFMDNGHYIRRKHMATFVHPKNNNAQCCTCNQVREAADMERAYEIALEVKYGQGTVAELRALKHTTKKFSAIEVMEIIAFCDQEIARLKKEKNLR